MLVNVPEWVEHPDRLKVPYQGVVVDNMDPKKLGRVKVQIADLFTGLAASDLPWVCVLNPSGTGGKLLNSGFSVPEVGSNLVVVFPYNDVYFPFYTGYWQNSTNHQLLFDTNYPERYGFRDSTGVEVYIDKSDHSVGMLHPSGCLLTIDMQGTVNVTTPGTMNIHSDKDMTINSGTHITMVAPRIDFNP